MALSKDLILELVSQVDSLINCVLLNNDSVQSVIHLLIVRQLFLMLTIIVLYYSTIASCQQLLSFLNLVLNLMFITQISSFVGMLVQVIEASFL